MAFFENLPFPIGKTYFGSGTASIGAAGDADLAIEGAEYWTTDTGLNVNTRRSNRVRLVRAVRNEASITLAPGRLVEFKATAGLWGTRVDGYAATYLIPGYPVDEYLVSNVAIHDIFWIVMRGPAVCNMPGTQIADVTTIGSVMVANTVSASTNTTLSGCVGLPDFSGASSTGTQLASLILNYVGRALSAVSSSLTDSAILVDIKG